MCIKINGTLLPLFTISIFNSYSPFLANYIYKTASHHNVTWTPTSFVLRTIHWIEPLSWGMCKSWTTGLPRSAEMQAEKRVGNYSNCILNALPLLVDIRYGLYYCVNWVFVLPVYWLAALYWWAGILKQI